MLKRLLVSCCAALLGLSHALATAAGQPGVPSGTLDATAVELKRALRLDSQNWDNYFELGNYLLKSGRPAEEAAKVLLEFPGFHQQHPQDPTVVAEYANNAGSLFYALGLPELTRPFYRVAADLDTGSDASLCDAQRLKLLDGDYAGAAQVALSRGDRFGNANAYRDYLSLLHVIGQGDAAWRSFAQLRDAFDNPQIWISALIAQRLAGKSEGDIRAWLLQPEIRAAHSRAYHFATHEALWAFSTDRLPPTDLGALIEQLDGPPVARADTRNGVTVIPHPTTPDATALVPSSHFRDGKRTQLPAGTLIKSAQAFFADAYAALRHGQFDVALQRFDDMADHYQIEHYPLAYFAYAAAHEGDPERLEAYIESLSRPPYNESPSFDQWLAKAFFAGKRRDTNTALMDLRAAVRLRPYTDDRPVLTEYQYAEACEWLYRETGDPRFVDELLDWARKQQAVQPIMAWAYTVQYQYEKPGAARTRALAMADYLDPTSARTASATRAEHGSAQAWFAEHRPFSAR
jgi:tetratricopeptide (TPR) repeat protein